MNKAKIENSDWAKRFLAECPTSYQEAIELAQKVEWVTVEQRDDHSSRGDYLWVVVPEIAPNFWLESMQNKSAVLAVCREMGWRVRRNPRN